MTRPKHWGPVRPYQPPKGMTILRVRLTSDEYRRRKARYSSLEDSHMNGDGTYYRRLCYETIYGEWVEAQGPHVRIEEIDVAYPPYCYEQDVNDLEDELMSGEFDFMWWPL